MSLPKLTSLSTQTLSLLLERQRLLTLPSFSSSTDAQSTKSSPHLPQITRNLIRLRTGILELEAKDGRSEAIGLLRSQYGRMRDMLGGGGNVERYNMLLITSFMSFTLVFLVWTQLWRSLQHLLPHHLRGLSQHHLHNPQQKSQSPSILPIQMTRKLVMSLGSCCRPNGE
jgi:hypothetical protein